MNAPLTPEEMAAEHMRQADEARTIAAQFTGGQSAMPAGPPGPNMSVAEGVPAGPPPPPAPAKPGMGSLVGRGLKDAGVMAASTLLGPIGPALAGNYVNSKNAPPPPLNAPPGPPGEEAGPPPPPAEVAGDDGPMILNQQGGRGGMVSPAGMYPQSMTTQAHMGRAVPGEARQAFGASTALSLEGAEAQRGADRQYYEQVRDTQALRMKANDDAAVQHARVQAERDAEVKQRLGQIEQLNAEASAQIDPEKFWHDRGALAKVMGAFAIGLGALGARSRGGANTALHIIEGSINREIDAQKANQAIARNGVAQQERLLGLHMAAFGDQDKAIDATKLGLIDNVLAQMESYKANHGAQMSEANYLNVQAGILEKRGELVNKMALQATDDVNKSYTEAWHNAQYAGGGGVPAGKMEGYELIPVPASDQTAEKGQMIAVPKGSHQKLGEIVGSTNTLIGINQDALARIQEIKADMERVKAGDTGAVARIQANRKTLEDLGQRKASYMSSAEGQGVLKEAEFERAMSDRVMFNDWWKPGVDVQKRIQAQNNGLAGAAGRMVQGVGGQHVKMAYVRDKNGALQPNPLFTGRMYAPPPVGPEMGPVTAPSTKPKVK